jgi:hypothetical protein
VPIPQLGDDEMTEAAVIRPARWYTLPMHRSTSHRDWVPPDGDTPGHWLTTFDAQVRVGFAEDGTILHIAIDDGQLLITANCDPVVQSIVVAAPPEGEVGSPTGTPSRHE